MTFARVNNPGIRLSVIIPYFEKPAALVACIEALRGQSLTRCLPDAIEIIVIDDGSEGDDIRPHLPDDVIYLWQRKHRYGIARAKNTGGKVANGAYLVFLDPDLRVIDTYLDAVLAGFEQFGDRVVQTGYFWDYHFKGCPDPRTEFGVWEIGDAVSTRFFQFAGGNAALSRAVFRETAGFDEALIHGGVEDLVFGYQLSQTPGTAMYFNRGMMSWHTPHAPSLAHANARASWAVVRVKYPVFYEDYIVKGLR